MRAPYVVLFREGHFQLSDARFELLARAKAPPLNLAPIADLLPAIPVMTMHIVQRPAMSKDGASHHAKLAEFGV
jgi:hypothetical protein